MATNKLTDTLCKRAGPSDKPYKLSDGHGLFLFVTPAGGKLWRAAYQIGGKEQTAAYGPYPLLSLADARIKHSELRLRVLNGENVKAKPAKSITFSKACELYWEGRKDVTPKYVLNATRGLSMHLKPLTDVPVGIITKAMVLEPLMILNAEEKFVYARRIRIWASMVFEWAMAHDHCATNPVALINPKTTFGHRRVKHFASVALRDVPALVARLALERDIQSVLACRMMAITWVRTKELRLMRWTDIEGDLWRIPDKTMKKDREHLVPLPAQAMALLDTLKMRCRGSEFVFPNDRRSDRPMSENSVLYMLGRIGYAGIMTGHGLRSLASTWANELGYEPDAIEVALSHSADAKDAVRSAYNQAQYLPQRRKMLQDYANWWDAQGQVAIPA